MAEDDVLAAGVEQHVGRDLTGIGAGGVGVAVFSADADAGLAHGADSSRDADGRHAQRHVTPAALGHDGFELGHKRLGLRRRLVHLPVARDNSLAILSVHCESPKLYIKISFTLTNPRPQAHLTNFLAPIQPSPTMAGSFGRKP